MDLLNTWHDYRYWCKILFGTIPTPAFDLEFKVRDLEIYVKNFASKLLRFLNFKILAWIYFIFDMIIDIGAKFYLALSPTLLMT